MATLRVALSMYLIFEPDSLSPDSRFMERLISEFSFHRYEGRNMICKASAQIDRYLSDELAIGIQIVVVTSLK